MPMVDLYVIAAGLGSRMGMGPPKALVPIDGIHPCLTTTLQQIAHRFAHVFVVSNIRAADEWDAYFNSLHDSSAAWGRGVTNLPIESGLGDGHAVLHGMLAAERMLGPAVAEDVVITWGDVFFQDGSIIDELLSSALRGSALLPARWEENPYVTLLVNEKMQCVAAAFSKHGELRPAGYHDQSVFRFSRTKLIASLFDLHDALWKNDCYITPGGELSLLYVFHLLYNRADPACIYQTAYSALSFNTVEDMMAIQRRIKDRSRVNSADQGLPLGRVPYGRHQ